MLKRQQPAQNENKQKKCAYYHRVVSFLKKLCTATTTTTNALQKKKRLAYSGVANNAHTSLQPYVCIYIYDVYTHILWVSYHLILFFLSTVEVNEYKLQSKSLDGRAQQAFQALCLCFPYTTRVSLSLLQKYRRYNSKQNLSAPAISSFSYYLFSFGRWATLEGDWTIGHACLRLLFQLLFGVQIIK